MQLCTYAGAGCLGSVFFSLPPALAEVCPAWRVAVFAGARRRGPPHLPHHGAAPLAPPGRGAAWRGFGGFPGQLDGPRARRAQPHLGRGAWRCARGGAGPEGPQAGSQARPSAAGRGGEGGGGALGRPDSAAGRQGAAALPVGARGLFDTGGRAHAGAAGGRVLAGSPVRVRRGRGE
eukprot:128448-Lingulodinium_polyedra.AAC.1